MELSQGVESGLNQGNFSHFQKQKTHNTFRQNLLLTVNQQLLYFPLLFIWLEVAGVVMFSFPPTLHHRYVGTEGQIPPGIITMETCLEFIDSSCSDGSNFSFNQWALSPKTSLVLNTGQETMISKWGYCLYSLDHPTLFYGCIY